MEIEATTKGLYRTAYRNYINYYKNKYSFDDVINNRSYAFQLAFVKECHHYIMCDMCNDEELFKKLYDDICMYNSQYSECQNVYLCLVNEMEKVSNFDIREWGFLRDFIKCIIERKTYETIY